MAKRLKRFSTSFKVIAIAGILLVAAYTIKLFTTGTKQKIVAEEPLVTENHPVKKHRNKHKRKSYLAIAKKTVVKKDTVRVVTPSVVTAPKPDPAKVVVPKLDPVKAVVPNIVAVPKTAPVKSVGPVTPLPIKQPTENNNGFLYTTYVHPNVTGIVKMRLEDKFSSNIIADIPANAKVQVLQKGQMYYRIAYNNNVGFVPKWSLQDK